MIEMNHTSDEAHFVSCNVELELSHVKS